ncbi:Mechanosensitive ion channel [Saccharicrinis carchari]|uniref:Mechanosensitive ion channel n=1 Tax=Saccharicrinis carchari TaxID=1168039 RepID=A0A521AW14_SACCC|nr:mechanosensitive ion channel domain-containing protein [Saccharicrinis carchari]SMO39026.1 Mechanosensitive ion channel [Saccharicrinis carchari]
MQFTTILYIVLILMFNAGIIWGSILLRKKYTEGIKAQLLRAVLFIVIIAIVVFSIDMVFRIFNVNLIDTIDVELFRIGANIPITGFLLAFLFFTFSFLIIINRFLSKAFTQSKGINSIPKKMTTVARRWVSFLAFLILMRGIIGFTDHSFQFFTISLFSIQNVQITIGKILQVMFIAYSVHTAIMVLEVFFDRRIYQTGIDAGKGHTVFLIVKYFAWVIAVTVIIGSLGIKVTVLLAGSAALFVGLGFGVQSLFNDFVSGLMILFEGTIRVNDVVELENGIVGKVQEIGLRTSKVLNRDSIIIIIPNNNFVGKNVINWTYNEHKTRFKVNVGVAYGSDVRLVEKLLIESVLEHEKVHKHPQPVVFFNDFGESALEFSVFFWSEESFWVERVRSDIRFNIYDKFNANNIQIPFPQRDVHLRSGFESLQHK